MPQFIYALSDEVFLRGKDKIVNFIKFVDNVYRWLNGLSECYYSRGKVAKILCIHRITLFR